MAKQGEVRKVLKVKREKKVYRERSPKPYNRTRAKRLAAIIAAEFLGGR